MFTKILHLLQKSQKIKLPKNLFLFLLIFGLIAGLRGSGLMQIFELYVLDLYFKNRPSEIRDDRIVIVGITEEDYQKLQPYYPMDDAILAELLLKIKKQSPRIIGLDLTRDLPIAPVCEDDRGQPRLKEIFTESECKNGSQNLLEIFEKTKNLVGVGKLGGDKSTTILPHYTLLKNKRGTASDVVVDPDGFLRRGLLLTLTQTEEYPEGVVPNLSYYLASYYLLTEGIKYRHGDNYSMIYGETVLERFETNDGSYVNANDAGTQSIINWRTPPANWNIISLFDVLEGKISEELFKDKIVLIGSVQKSSNDIFDIPYYREFFDSPDTLYGVLVHANVTSQIISAVLDDRPLIRVIPDWLEYLIIGIPILLTVFWSSFLDSRFKQKNKFNILLLTLAVILPAAVGATAIVYYFFELFVLKGLWLPVVPVVLGIGASAIASITVIFAFKTLHYQRSLERSNLELKQINEALTVSNINLDRSKSNLQQFLDALPVGVFICDRSGNPYYTNDAAKHILGDRFSQISTAAELKQSYRIYKPDAMTPQTGEEWPILKALDGIHIKSLDLEIEMSSTERKAIEVNASPIYDENEKITYAIAAFEDVSERERLKLENQLLQPVTNSSDYQVGGGLEPTNTTYVVRDCDRQFYQALLKNKFCYIFSPRQMGKSSLKNKTICQLLQKDYRCAALDLTQFGSTDLTLAQWYGCLTFYINQGLKLTRFKSDTEIMDWWDSLNVLSPLAKFKHFIYHIVLKEIDTKIFIFIDEIDSVRRLSFNTDCFFALLRSFYEDRALNPDLNRINFILLGAAPPDALIENPISTPFNIGVPITLLPFKEKEIVPLTEGIKHLCVEPLTVLKEILTWTGGQPFLTQKICHLLREKIEFIELGSEREFIGEFIHNQIITNWEDRDRPPHLETIKSNILKSSYKNDLLKLYQRILSGETVAWNGSKLHQRLLLSGIVSLVNNKLQVFNLIYETIFNKAWILENL
ncbi:MAG: CHASE2 domain-containing protein [Prochloraceae cyanobacterium]